MIAKKRSFLQRMLEKGVKNHSDRLFWEENLKDECKRI